MRMILRHFVATVFLAVGSLSLFAEVRLPAVISNNMVLQRDSQVAIWGWATAGEKVAVRGTWGGSAVETIALADGKWRVDLPTGPAGGLHDVIVVGSNTITVKDVLLGEVWLCSGQSNMEWSLGPVVGPGVENWESEIKTAEMPSIRLFRVPHKKSDTTQADVEAKWELCSADTARAFSGVGFFFGRRLHKDLNVPIGLIQSTWGGTPVEFWMSEPAMRAIPDLAASIEKRVEGGKPRDYTVLYNGMVAPLVPYGVRGFLWYQGEANCNRAVQYRTSFAAMITQWRSDWGRGDLPFYFVQIAPFEYTKFEKEPPKDWPHPSAELREAQLVTLSVVNTGMVVTTDITDNVADIHPKNKLDVGNRLARIALARDYGRKDMVYSGPIYKSMTVEGGAIRLNFEHLGGGLVCKGSEFVEFTIAGEDRKFVPATAKIDGDSIVVHAAGVAKPVAVRMGWTDTAIPSLFNAAGLPASPFRTDDWPTSTASAKW
ncbi:MAG: sialate O-acetylesterase [Phycisphaerae bacterium]